MKSGNLNFLEPSGPLQACNSTDLPAFLTVRDENKKWLNVEFPWHIHNQVTFLIAKLNAK